MEARFLFARHDVLDIAETLDPDPYRVALLQKHLRVHQHPDARRGARSDQVTRVEG